MATGEANDPLVLRLVLALRAAAYRVEVEDLRRHGHTADGVVPEPAVSSVMHSQGNLSVSRAGSSKSTAARPRTRQLASPSCSPPPGYWWCRATASRRGPRSAACVTCSETRSATGATPGRSASG